MSVFGSREDDPLLQNDPLAPSAPDSASDPPDERDPPDAASGDEDAVRGESVFERTETYRVVRSRKEAANGRLDELQRLVEQGWSLSHIELRSPPSTPRTQSLVFVFERDQDESGRPPNHE